MEIVTAHKGKAHVTAEKMAELNRGIVGAESYVMDGGRQFESELVSNNLLKVYDGSGMMQGRHICIPVGQSDELTIENGNQGMKRIDLVVVRYTKDENTKIENAETIVIKGTPSESAPVAPSYIEGDIRSGDMTVDWPLYEVELDGISVVEVRPLFKVLMNMSEIEKMLTELNGNLSELQENQKMNFIPSSELGVNSPTWKIMFASVYKQNGTTHFFAQAYTDAPTVANAEYRVFNLPEKIRPKYSTGIMANAFKGDGSGACACYANVQSTGGVNVKIPNSTCKYVIFNGYWQ